MSSLFGLLDLGAGALAASNAGIAVASNNTANVNTEGYSRQRVDLEAQLAAPLVGGVRFGDPQRISSDLLAGRQRDSAGAFGLADAYLGSLLSLEGSLTAGGRDLSAAMADVFASLERLAASPFDTHARDAFVGSARDVASSFNRQAQQIELAREDADARIAARAGDVTALAQQIADANRALQISGDPVIADRRELAAARLAELVGGYARIDSDGNMRFLLGDGTVMVDGTRAARMVAAPDPARGGMVSLQVVDGASTRDVTGSLDSGTIGGDLRFRDSVAVQLATDVDQLAFDFASALNGVHQANAAVDGSTGRPLFSVTGSATGAAAAIAVDPAIAGDSSLVAAAGAGQGSSSNQGAIDLLALRDQALAAGGARRFGDEAIRMLADLGREAATARADREFQDAQRSGLASLRDSISGVSIQEELTRLSQFKNAADATSRFLATIDGLLGRLIQDL